MTRRAGPPCPIHAGYDAWRMWTPDDDVPEISDEERYAWAAQKVRDLLPKAAFSKLTDNDAMDIAEQISAVWTSYEDESIDEEIVEYHKQSYRDREE